MPTTKLLEKLLEIERSLGRVDSTALRHMLIDAETHLLKLQQEVIVLLDEMSRLRQEHAANATAPLPRRGPVTSWAAPQAAVTLTERAS